MGGYNDRVLISHYKKYSRDETVAKLVSVLRSLKREIGVLTSERDEARYKAKQRKEEIKTLKKKINFLIEKHD